MCPESLCRETSRGHLVSYVSGHAWQQQLMKSGLEGSARKFEQTFRQLSAVDIDDDTDLLTRYQSSDWYYTLADQVLNCTKRTATSTLRLVGCVLPNRLATNAPQGWLCGFLGCLASGGSIGRRLVGS